MSIEKFLPKNVSSKNPLSILDKMKRLLVKKDIFPVHREIYNSDKTRRFNFDEFRDGDISRQLLISLYMKTGGDGWNEAMGIKAMISTGKEQFFGLTLDAIIKESRMSLESFGYDRHTGGLQRKMGLRFGSVKLEPDENRKIAESLGFIYASDLPQYVDFEKTAREFMFQAKNLDFSNPVLYPKELLK